MANAEQAQVVPALIVGMGGSGDWVVREVKEAVLRSYGKVPENLSFLSIDTDRNVLGLVDDLSRAQDARAFGVEALPDAERAKLGGDIYANGQQVAAARAAYADNPSAANRAVMPQLQPWFIAEKYGNLNRQSWNLAAGSGQLRQFGRMSIFEGLRLGWGLEEAIGRAITRLGAPRQPAEVILVASLAGGTGAGMFIDVANLVRRMASARNLRISTVRAFLFMPRVFTNGIGNLAPQQRYMSARAFGALREAIRFATTDDWLGRIGYPIAYTPQEVGRPNSRVTHILFEHLYLIDGSGGNLDGTEPRLAHYPMVAEAIRSIIDASTTVQYQSVMQNLAAVRQRIGTRPACAGVGAFALVMPVQLWRAEFEARLVSEALEQLAPVAGTVLTTGAFFNGQRDQPGEIVVPRYLEGASVTVPSADGANMQVATSSFTRWLAQIIRRVPNQQADRNLINDLANQGPDEWRAGFDEVRDDGAARGVPDQAADAMVGNRPEPIESPHWRTASSPPGKRTFFPEEQHDTARRYVADQREYEATQFGVKVDGIRRGGEFGHRLKGRQAEHFKRFRDSLQAQIDVLLNPVESEEIERHSGRLGHAIGFATQLEKSLDKFAEVLRAVSAERNRQRRSEDAEGSAQVASDRMESVAYRARMVPDWTLALVVLLALGITWGTWIWWLLLPHPWWYPIAPGLVGGAIIAMLLATIPGPAYSSQDDFLAATQRMYDELQVDAVIRVMQDTTSTMLADVRAVVASLRAWGDAIRTNPNHSAWVRVETRRGEQKNLRGVLRRVKPREYLFDDAFERAEYQKRARDRNAVLALVKAVRWGKIDWEVGGSLATVSVAGRSLRLNAANPSATSEDVTNALNVRARETFDGIEEQISILDFLVQHDNYSNPERFAELLMRWGNDVSLALDGAPMMVGGQSVRTNYNFLRIMTPEGPRAGEQQVWVARLMDKIGEMRVENQNQIVLAPSRDRHSCALVLTSDFLDLAGGQVKEYQLCLEAYRQTGADPSGDGMQDSRSVLMTFAAEINADRVESLLPTIDEAHRLLDYRVVALLEDVDRVLLYVRARATGVVDVTAPAGANAVRRVVLRRDGEAARIGASDLLLTNESQTWPSIYIALRQFVFAARDWRANPTDESTVPPQMPIDFDEVERAVQEVLEREVPGDDFDSTVLLNRRAKELDLILRYTGGLAFRVGAADSPMARDLEAVSEAERNTDLKKDLEAALRVLVSGHVQKITQQVKSLP